MKRWSQFLREAADLFARITVGIVAATAAFITVFENGNETQLSVSILWQILFVGFACTAVSVGLWHLFPAGKAEISKKRMLLFIIVCFFLMNAVVLSCGVWFGWFALSNLPETLAMICLVFLVFVAVVASSYRTATMQAKKMNEKLKNRNERKR